VEDAQVLAKKIGDSTGEQKASDLLKEIASRSIAAAPTVVMAGPAAVPTAAAGPAASAAPATPTVVAGYVPPDIEVVKTRIIQMVQDMSGEDGLDADTPFMDAGIDSLASVELRTNLNKSFGVSLPSTVMFNYPTTLSIADFLVQEMTAAEVSLQG